MSINAAIISAFQSSNKRRTVSNLLYLTNKLQELHRNTVSSFEKACGEKPDTLFMSKFMLKCIVPNKTSIVINDYDNKIYYCGIRIIYTKVNIMVAALCSTTETIHAILKEINTSCYDLIKNIDAEYDNLGV